MIWSIVLLAITLAWLSVACAATGNGQPAPAAITARPSHAVWVVNHGWHAGIAIRRSDLRPDQWPEAAVFHNALYLEVGWGNARFYTADDPGLGTTLRAALWPSPSVLHIAGFIEPPTQFFSGNEVIQVEVSKDGLAALVDYIRSGYDRDAQGGVQPVATGLYGDSRFYAATENYHLFNNCNHWLARALKAAGKPVDPGDALTAKNLLRQVRNVGTVCSEGRWCAGSPCCTRNNQARLGLRRTITTVLRVLGCRRPSFSLTAPRPG